MDTAESSLPHETPDLNGAFPRLEQEQIEALAHHGERRRTQQDEVLCREGDEGCDFLVILRGRVAVLAGLGAGETVVAMHGPGRFLGELNLLTGGPALVSSVVREAGEVLAVPVQEVQRLVTHDPPIGDLILRAYLARRSLLIGLGAGMRIVGSRLSPASRRLREFAARNQVPHQWIDVEEDQEAEALLRQLGIAPSETPVVICHGGHVLRNPSSADLARVLGLASPVTRQGVTDLLIVGAGPAGLAAAVYGASEGLDTIALESISTGGQAGTSPRIENYLGFPAGLSGGELAERALLQAMKFGARFTLPAEATGLEQRDGYHLVTVDTGPPISARVVLVATGARYRKLPLPRLEEFEGSCVHYAATVVEARLCVGAPVAVVGGGNSAGQASLFLAQKAAAVRLIVRHADLGQDMSRYLVDEIERSPSIEVLRESEVRELIGSPDLEAIVVENNRTREQRTVEARTLFVFIGVEPHARWLGDSVALDENGFILTGPAAARAEGANGTEGPASRLPLQMETSCPGVFAAGDVRSGSIKRVASAVGEGAMAVRMTHEYLGHR
jgi:thioredoxin reductase (NADPH)